MILFVIILLLIGLFTLHWWYWYSSGQKKWEAIMKPCPKCGHKAIIVWYNGENNPPFYQPECGAYVRRNPGACDVTPQEWFDNLPPMTERQTTCKFLAGYCNEEKVPHFMTPRAAAKWWNRVGCKR